MKKNQFFGFLLISWMIFHLQRFVNFSIHYFFYCAKVHVHFGRHKYPQKMFQHFRKFIQCPDFLRLSVKKLKSVHRWRCCSLTNELWQFTNFFKFWKEGVNRSYCTMMKLEGNLLKTNQTLQDFHYFLTGYRRLGKDILFLF